MKVWKKFLLFDRVNKFNMGIIVCKLPNGKIMVRWNHIEPPLVLIDPIYLLIVLAVIPNLVGQLLLVLDFVRVRLYFNTTAFFYLLDV